MIIYMFINLFVNKKTEINLGPIIAWRIPADLAHVMVDN